MKKIKEEYVNNNIVMECLPITADYVVIVDGSQIINSYYVTQLRVKNQD